MLTSNAKKRETVVSQRLSKKVVHFDRDGWGTLTEIRSLIASL